MGIELVVAYIFISFLTGAFWSFFRKLERTAEKCTELEIEVKAIQKSTHSIHPVQVDTGLSKLEKELEKISSFGREDFSTDLQRAGFDEEV